MSAVIVCYRTPAELAGAIASLRAQSTPPDEIIVVDNGAADGFAVPEVPDGIRLVTPPVNLGFGAGCNYGARVAKGREILFLNADVVLTAEALEKMSERLRTDERIAAVGPRILSGGEIQLSARSFPTYRTSLLGRRSRVTRLLVAARRYPAEFRPAYSGSGRVDWVSGACALMRRSAFASVGGFDDGYWMYWEDADICRRLVDVGWEIWYETAAVVHHATGASGTSERVIRAFHESAARFASRHMARTRIERAVFSQMLRARTWLVLRLYLRGHAPEIFVPDGGPGAVRAG